MAEPLGIEKQRAIEAVAETLWGTDPYSGWMVIAEKAVDRLIKLGWRPAE